MAFELPALPYELDALAPHISKETLEFHYGKHHQAYVTNLNKLVEGTDKENSSLEDVIKTSDGGVFNNAAQVWNHSFYWNSMTPNGGGEPTGDVAEAINSAFGSYDEFKAKFAEAGTTQFGSGWAWLVQNDKGLEIVKTPNADNLLKNGDKALLTMDVWEHAYYIDFRNARPNYISTFIDSLINWEFVAKNMAS
ncbi:MAG: superoxide dismutase [Fe] [Acidimicrobiia bacterium]|nr:superoxide dismutase [Fe] [Acidimicrobiia bacterium]